MTVAVAADQRYTRARRCPVCDGAEADPRGQAKRCIGFVSSDGKYARCSREEKAGALEMDQGTQTYLHRLTGDCRCGGRHGGDQPATSATVNIVATYPYVDEAGSLLFEVVRLAPKTFRQRRRDAGGGWIWNRTGV